uniref:DNA methyltransferase n=1 Tax=uncultured marine virus TaxID=186617 RepID=A0A0F7L4Q2_9VIRU|nr:DNA methyltransferase [uncultured marine virus]
MSKGLEMSEIRESTLPLMGSRRECLASPSAKPPPENLEVADGSGQQPPRFFDRPGPSGSCLRTQSPFDSQAEDLMLWSVILPRWGMSANGKFIQLPYSEPHIAAPDYGWLPTPTTKANQTAPSMQKHPSCRNLTGLIGHGPIHPEIWEWAMGLPIGWTELEPAETP